MEIMYERCCGIDVHKRTIIACLKCGNTYEVRSCGTTSEEIRALVRWLLEAKCQMVAVEGTSAYSNAIYNACEVSHVPIMLVDSRYMKYVPGRSPGLKDAEWMVDLLQYGVLKAKHVQKREQRDLGGVFRYRRILFGERARELNYLQEMLEGGNIKLISVVFGNDGKSSYDLLLKMLDRDMPVPADEMESYFPKVLRDRVDDAMPAAEGFFTVLQKQLILQVADHIDDITKRIGQMDEFLKQYRGDR